MARRPKRKPINDGSYPVSTRLSKQQRDKLQQLEIELCRSTSDVIRMLIDYAQPSNLPPIVFKQIGGSE